MIDRYTRPEMGRVWSEQHKVDAWLRVEIAVCEGWNRRGRIPDWALSPIQKATCDIDRMKEIEKETDHDVIAFLRATGESVGEASRFIHLGLTSSDVVDTGLALQVLEAGTVLDEQLDRLIEAVRRLSIEHAHTITIGRTHGVHAEPTTFGLKALVWYDELCRHKARLTHAREDMRVGKISGAVGTHAHVPPDLEADVCKSLGLVADPASTQIVQRDRHAFFLSVLAGIGATIEKIAVEIRHLQRTEVREVEEPFGEGNQGSSAMPHKRNPHESERLSGLSRLLRGYAVTALENVALWHERDISHSSTERIIFPDATIVTDYSLDLLTEIIDGLRVFPDRMKSNLDLTTGLIYSQGLLLALVESGLDRQDAYKLVQRKAMRAWEHGESFRQLLHQDDEISRHLSPGEIDRILSPELHLRYVDEIYQRFGLTSSVPGEQKDAVAVGSSE